MLALLVVFAAVLPLPVAGFWGSYPQSKLIEASRRGHFTRVEQLLQYGADVNFTSYWLGHTALGEASRYGRHEVVALLLEHKAHVNQTYNSGTGGKTTALIQASENGHHKVVALLLQNKADVNARDSLNRTALHEAAGGWWRTDKHKQQKVLTLLLQHKADVTAVDWKGKTALHHAAAIGHQEIARMLISAGAEVDPKDGEGNTPLHIAYVKKHTRMVTYLASEGADKTRIPYHQRKALELIAAAEEGHLTPVELLLQTGAEINCSTFGTTALMGASLHGHSDVVALLLQHKADVNAKDRRNQTALHFAASGGLEEVIRILLNAGAEVDARDYVSENPLCHAFAANHTHVVAYLASKGADIGCIPFLQRRDIELFVRAQQGHLTRVEELMQIGADVNLARFKRGSGPTALMGASRSGHQEMVALLLQHNADVTAKDHLNQTALHHAAASGHVKVARMLISAGAEVDAQDNKGDTPLYVAFTANHTSFVTYLASEGADTTRLPARTPRRTLRQPPASVNTSAGLQWIDAWWQWVGALFGFLWVALSATFATMFLPVAVVVSIVILSVIPDWVTHPIRAM